MVVNSQLCVRRQVSPFEVVHGHKHMHMSVLGCSACVPHRQAARAMGARTAFQGWFRLRGVDCVRAEGGARYVRATRRAQASACDTPPRRARSLTSPLVGAASSGSGLGRLNDAGCSACQELLDHHLHGPVKRGLQARDKYVGQCDEDKVAMPFFCCGLQFIWT